MKVEKLVASAKSPQHAEKKRPSSRDRTRKRGSERNDELEHIAAGEDADVAIS